MSIKARIDTDVNGNIIVHMQGGLGYENSIHLKQELYELVQEHPLAHITLDLNQLDFVGSSGIGQFVRLIEEINQNHQHKIRLSNVKTEFARIIRHYGRNIDDLMMEEFSGPENLNFSQFSTKKRRIFEN